MGWPQYLDQNNQPISSVQFFSLLKWAKKFTLFSATRLAVSKIDPAVIVSSRKICEMISSLSPGILYHQILPLSRLWKIMKVQFELSGTQDTVQKHRLRPPFNLDHSGV